MGGSWVRGDGATLSRRDGTSELAGMPKSGNIRPCRTPLPSSSRSPPTGWRCSSSASRPSSSRSPRPELDFVPYRFAVAAADPPPLRGLGGIRVDVRRRARAAARGGPDRRAGLARSRRHAARRRSRRRCATPSRAARASRRSAPARFCWRMPACSTAAARPRTGATPNGSRGCFRTIRVEPDVLYVDEGNVMTSAGSAAGIDMLLHLVRKDYGAAYREHVSRAAWWCRRIATAGSRSSSCSRSRCAPTTASRASPTGWRAI